MGTPKDFPLDPGWRLVIQDLGIAPADVLRRAGLADDLLLQSDVRVSTPEYFRFWRALEGLIDHPAFPIRLVEAVTTETFIPAFFASICSRDLLTAARRLSTYKRLFAPMRLHVVDDPQTLELRFEWLDQTVRPPPSLMAAELAFLVHLTRTGTRERVVPLRVSTLEALDGNDRYAEYFGVTPVSDDVCGLVFSGSDAARPFLTANARMWETFEPQLRRRLGELDASASTTERVRALLLESLPSGQTSMEQIASRLGVSKRTLQRRLREESISYQELVAEVREALALHYLTRTELSNAEISFLLGFEDPNSFFRAFREWTGATPEATRREARA